MKSIVNIGDVFNRLTVVAKHGRDRNGKTIWVCDCSCGGKTVARSSSLTSSNTKSCGCLKRDTTTQRNITHGMTKNRLYRVWANIKARTTNPKAKYYNYYGGRGITLCKRWYKFENFFADMNDSFVAHEAKHKDGHRSPNTQIDRINNNKGYSPSNCRWATRIEQANNKRPLTDIQAKLQATLTERV